MRTMRPLSLLARLVFLVATFMSPQCLYAWKASDMSVGMWCERQTIYTALARHRSPLSTPVCDVHLLGSACRSAPFTGGVLSGDLEPPGDSEPMPYTLVGPSPWGGMPAYLGAGVMRGAHFGVGNVGGDVSIGKWVVTLCTPCSTLPSSLPRTWSACTSLEEIGACEVALAVKICWGRVRVV